MSLFIKPIPTRVTDPTSPGPAAERLTAGAAWPEVAGWPAGAGLPQTKSAYGRGRLFGGGDWTAAERWDEMARVMRPVFTSQDAQEGARAFAEKRAPVWKGR